MAEIAHADVEEKHQQDQKNHGETSPGELGLSGTYNPIRVYFLQRVTWDTGYAFERVDKTIWEFVLLHLFFQKTKTLSPIVGSLSTTPIKVAGIILLNPVTSEKKKYLIYHQGSAELIRYVTGEGHYLMPTAYICTGKKDVTERKTEKPQT